MNNVMECNYVHYFYVILNFITCYPQDLIPSVEEKKIHVHMYVY